MTRRRGRGTGALAAVVAVLALVGGAQAQVPLELRFDGQAFEPPAPPDFTCFDATRGRWVSCRVQKAAAPGAYVLERPEPGQYRMHVSVDANPANPRRYPGDYEAQPRFEVTETGPARVLVDLARLIHLTRPGDNGRSLEGMLTGCATQPVVETPRHSWGPVARVEFAWEPVVAGAEYRYVLSAMPCGRSGSPRELRSGETDGTELALDLSPSGGGEHYVFRVEAWKDGRLVGDLYTHDAGTHSWNYRFRVRDASVPRWGYVVAAAGVAALLLGAHWMVAGVDRRRRRRRLRGLVIGTVAIALAGTAAGVAARYAQGWRRQQAEARRVAEEAERQARQREFIAAFASAAPRPDWWDRVETPYRVDSLGDLLSAWQGHPRDAGGEQRFFKAAYQGILDHPDDEHVVATAITLLHHVVRDYPHRLGLARFGYERYLHHRQRTDNCASCMVGDTTQALAQALGELYAAEGRYDEAIEVGRRLIDIRGGDVSPYKLAETWNQIAWAHWHRGERDRALEVARAALARHGDTVRADLLRETLARFERER